MLPSLLVAAVVTAPGAPIPLDAIPNTTGPAPRVVAVKADGTGAVWITAYVYQKQKVQQQFFAIENGQQVMKQQEVEQLVSNYVRKTIGEFGGKFSTADGTGITADEATKRVKGGATLLITSDGKPLDKGWLKAVSGDTVVMAAEGLAHAQFQYNQYPNQNGTNVVLPTTATPRLTMFCADESGAVRVTVNSNPTNGNGQVYYDDFGGGRIRGGRAVMIQNANWDTGGYASASVGPDGKKLLRDVQFDAYDVSGKLVSKSEALKRLKAGGLVLLAGDNRFPDADYVKAFREDLLVLASGEFVFPAGQNNPYDMAVKAAETKAPGNKPAVPAPGVLLPAQPGIQIQAAPAVIKRVQIAPAVEPPADIPAEKPAAKPELKPAAKPAELPAKPAPDVKPAVKRD